MEVFDKIIKLLEDNKIDYRTFEHEYVHTSKDAAKTRGTDIKDAAKALVLKTKSGNFFMLVVPGDKKAELKIVKKLVGEKNCSLAPPEEVYEVTGCKVGTVPPLGNLFGLDVYFEKSLLERKQIVFSAASHYKSISMKPEDYVKIVNPKIEVFSK